MVEKPPIHPLRPDQALLPESPDDHLAFIGRLIVEWSRLENALEDMIWHFLDLSDDDGRVITCRLDARSKTEMLGAFDVRYLSPTLAGRLANVLKLIRELQEARNLVAHGAWGILMPENIPVALSLRIKGGLPER